MNAKSHSYTGFTLIELLVVVGIIAVLSGIITVALSGAQQDSRDSKRIADIQVIKTALAAYYSDNRFYPKNIYSPYNSADGVSPLDGLAPVYLSVVPKDPKSTGTNDCTVSASLNSYADCYHYTPYYSSASACASITTNTPVIYHLGAKLEDTANKYLSEDAVINTTLNPPYSTTFSVYSPGGTGCPVVFHGDAAACSGSTAAATDNCYSVTP